MPVLALVDTLHILAQAQPAGSGNPDLAVSRNMGTIIFACLVAAVVVAAISKAAKGKKK